MSEYFSTVSTPGEGEFKDRGSKFLGFTYHVESEEEITERVQELKKKFYDARHHCFAFIMGPKQERTRANDDGEPNHSAGDPILGQIRSANLTDTLVVVVRYFGGTKLGVPGLVNAYREAAAEAIKNAELVEVVPKVYLSLDFTYNDLGTVEKWMTDFACEQIDRDFTTGCKIHFQMKEELLDSFRDAIKDFYMIKLKVHE